MRQTIHLVPVLLAATFLVLAGCKSSDDDSGGSASSASAPDCSGGSEAGAFDSDAPSWIQDNFICVKVEVDGDNLVITTRNLPPYTSYYYGSDSDRYDPTVPDDSTNPNQIEEQNVIMTVPMDSAIAGSPSDTALGTVGIAVDGVVIYNDEAGPGDNIADEAATFDVNDGHPQQNGVYHYHLEPGQLTNNDAALVGIAADGFPIFGRKGRNGSAVIADSSVDNWHDDDDTDLFEGENMPHYHIVDDNPLTDSDLATVQLRYMVSSQYGGTPGTVDGGL